MLWLSVIIIELALMISGLSVYSTYDREGLGGGYIYGLIIIILVLISSGLIISKKFYQNALPFFLVFSSMIYLVTPIADEIFMAPIAIYALLFRNSENTKRRRDVQRLVRWKTIRSCLRVYDIVLIFMLIYGFIGLHTFDPRIIKQAFYYGILFIFRLRIFDLTYIVFAPSSINLIRKALLIGLGTNVFHGILQFSVNPTTPFGSVDGVLGIQSMSMLFPVPIILFFLANESKVNGKRINSESDYAFNIIVLTFMLFIAIMSDSRSALIYVIVSFLIILEPTLKGKLKYKSCLVGVSVVLSLVLLMCAFGSYIYNDIWYFFDWFYDLGSLIFQALFTSDSSEGNIARLSYKGYSVITQTGDYGRKVIAIHSLIHWLDSPLSLIIGSGDYSYYEVSKLGLDNISESLTGSPLILPPGFKFMSFGPFYVRPPTFGTIVVERGYTFAGLILFYGFKLIKEYRADFSIYSLVLLLSIPVISSFVFNFNDLLILMFMLSPISFFYAYRKQVTDRFYSEIP